MILRALPQAVPWAALRPRPTLSAYGTEGTLPCLPCLMILPPVAIQ